jgi:hypothetical protein
MATNKRPEPGIATDDELREAAKAIADAVDGDLIKSVQCDRFDTHAGLGGDSWTEVITVTLSEKRQATEETIINDVLKSDAPTRLRTLERNEDGKLTFYPTNQAE